MLSITDLLELDVFYTSDTQKNDLQARFLSELTNYHYQHCLEYRKVLDHINGLKKDYMSASELPYIPVRLFKDYELKSVPQESVFKTMTSSGTTGQKVSKIFLDKNTASLQTKSLVATVNSFIGNKRLPMLIIDSPSVVRDRRSFSARGAGILGFSIFGRDKVFALNDDMTINIEAIKQFLVKHNGKPLFIFGFTYIIWLHFVDELNKLNLPIDLSKGIMFHGGGWKKLIEQSVTDHTFKAVLKEKTGLEKIYNYYGMVEQTGSIFVECEHGYMHSSIFNDVLVRSTDDLSVLPPGERGVLQVISLLPGSYPGHSLLTEDEGEIIGLNGCPCGRTGTYFKVYGRLANAEVRGCSDTYEKTKR
ncbi:hypothetical protein VISI1226_16823 [Vibrio sinaloensis DSM 21326]|uniref:Acyl-protein synthetase LuxE domain-containing protein n=1 Tax=Vibrio sinaloensis DSM 21326 TaxID=945550 RepID=E8M571_PHOS4|nr:acyl-protein synthetase [Vibrio sinaloensis]EGA70922.1 hypothetical protein VISI1226_16823 [Vibrio sinaloensis DSM 21326]